MHSGHRMQTRASIGQCAEVLACPTIRRPRFFQSTLCIRPSNRGICAPICSVSRNSGNRSTSSCGDRYVEEQRETVRVQPKKQRAFPSEALARITPKRAREDDLWGMLMSQISKGIGILAFSAGLWLFMLAEPNKAEAARSGGRMGGMRSSFSSSYAMSRSDGLRSSMQSMRGGPRGMRQLGGGVQTNAFFFSPFGFGFGYGYPMGGGMMSLLFWGVFAAILIQVIRGSMGDGGDEDGYLASGSKLSVAKVQVGLLSNARELQRDLERIASRADTSSPKGLHYVLQETVLALMRNPDYCVYGFAKSGIEGSPEEAESRFNKLSLEERGKFQKETRVNVGGMRQESSLGGRSGGGGVGELIVVTILVAAEGRVRLPKVNSRNQLRDALSTLGSIPAEDVYAVEVLWTPEEEGDYFSQEDLAYDYPLLNTL